MTTELATFEKAVKRYNDIDKWLALIADQSKPIKKERADLNKYIIKFLEDTNRVKIETDDSNLLLSKSVAQKPLTMDLLSSVFAKTFTHRPEMQMRLLADIKRARENAGERARLKRVKHRKQTTASATANLATKISVQS